MIHARSRLPLEAYSRPDRATKTLFYVTATVILMKDALNVADHYVRSPIPPSAIALGLSTLCILVFFVKSASSRPNPWVVTSLALVAFFYISFLLYTNGSSGSVSMREMAGVYLVNGAVPLFAISSAAYTDTNRLIFSAKFIGTITVFTLAVCFAELSLIWIDRNLVVGELYKLYVDGVIAYPLQTASGEALVRLSGPFYSAFGLCLFLSASSSYYMFRKSISANSAVMISLCFVVVLFTYNRNGLFVFCAVAASSFLVRVFGIGNRRVMALAFSLVVAAVLVAPALIGILWQDTADSSAWLKSSTLFSRLSTWRDIVRFESDAFLYGTGFIQGLGRAGNNQQLFIDNFYLYIAYQVGLIGLCAYVYTTVLVPMRMLYAKVIDIDEARAYYLLCCGMLAFILNIVFFEPVFQMLFFCPALGIISRSRLNKSTPRHEWNLSWRVRQ